MKIKLIVTTTGSKDNAQNISNSLFYSNDFKIITPKENISDYTKLISNLSLYIKLLYYSGDI